MLLSKAWKKQSQSQRGLSLNSPSNHDKDSSKQRKRFGVVALLALIRNLFNKNETIRGFVLFLSGFVVCWILIKPPKIFQWMSNNSYDNYVLYQPSAFSQKPPEIIHKLGGKDTKGINIFPFLDSSSSKSNKYQHLNYEYCQQITPSWIWNLHRYENRIYSQSGEDGITQQLIDHLLLNGGRQSQNKNDKDKDNFFYVEFGTEDGSQCNTRILRELYKFSNGLLMDGSNSNPTINLYQETITPDNVVKLFEKYNVPKDLDGFDYLSEDTDYADYYIWKSILEDGKYKPKIVVSEINPNFLPYESATVHRPPTQELRYWKNNNNYFGVSALALKRLWNKNNYIMIYCNFNQINCYGIRKDLLLQQQIDNDKEKEKRINIKEVAQNYQNNYMNIVDDIQECLWRKPMAYQRKLHKYDTNKEKYCWVNENGDIEDNKEEEGCNYVPSFVTIEDFIPWQRKSDPTFSH